MSGGTGPTGRVRSDRACGTAGPSSGGRRRPGGMCTMAAWVQCFGTDFPGRLSLGCSGRGRAAPLVPATRCSWHKPSTPLRARRVAVNRACSQTRRRGSSDGISLRAGWSPRWRLRCRSDARQHGTHHRLVPVGPPPFRTCRRRPGRSRRLGLRVGGTAGCPEGSPVSAFMARRGDRTLQRRTRPRAALRTRATRADRGVGRSPTDRRRLRCRVAGCARRARHSRSTVRCSRATCASATMP